MKPTPTSDPDAGGFVSLHVWRVPARRSAHALWRVARDRSRLRRMPGVRFAKLLGTGRGRQFGPTRADPTRWAALIAWADASHAARFDASPVGRAWRAIAVSSCRIDLSPMAARGRWAGRQPFGPGTWWAAAGEPAPSTTLLALTRARLRPSRALTFWRAIGSPATAASGAPGLLAAFGIGEAPIGWQGTVSLWRSGRDLVEFAYRHPHHAAVIDRSPTERWYTEELFARFAVLTVVGDRGVIGWTADEADESERTVSP